MYSIVYSISMPTVPNNITKSIVGTQQDLHTAIGGRHEGFLALWGEAIPLVSITVVTLFANSTIFLMFIRTRSLWKCRNIYIASLAVADLLFGCTLPLSVYETLSGRWILSRSSCLTYLTMRQSLLYVSLFSIILISVDRWWSIKYPFSYRVRQSRRLASATVIVSWILSFFIYIPSIIGWDIIAVNQPKLNENFCRLPYRHHSLFVIVCTIVTYFLPLLLLWTLNIGIYCTISRRKGVKIRRSMSATDTYFINYRKSSSDSENNGDETATLFPQASQQQVPMSGGMIEGRRGSLIHASTWHYNRRNNFNQGLPSRHMRNSTFINGHVYARRTSLDSSLTTMPSYRSGSRKMSTTTMYTPTTKTPFSRKQSDDLVREFLGKQDKKAACSLGLLVIVFTICLTPGTILAVLEATLDTPNIPQWLIIFTQWLLASNSAINPFLYGIGNVEFRKVLTSWFYCQRQKPCKLQDALLYCNNILEGDYAGQPEFSCSQDNVLREQNSDENNDSVSQ